MQIPAHTALAAEGRVLVQKHPGLPVRQPGKPGMGADVVRADDLAGPRLAMSRRPSRVDAPLSRRGSSRAVPASQ